MKNQAHRSIQWLAVSVAYLLPFPALSQSHPGEDSARSILSEALQAKNPETRQHAVESMALLAGQEPFEARLEAMLQDKDVKVRVAAIASLTMSPAGSTIDALKKALHDPAPEVSFAAAKALFTLGDEAGREALVTVLNGESKTSSGIIAERKREAARMLYEPKKLTVFVATKSVWLAPVPGLGFGVSSVQHAFFGKHESGRAVTAMLLATEDGPEAMAALHNALHDKDAAVRTAAIQAMALRNDPGMQADLAPLLEDKSQPVRLWAAAGFLRMEGLKSAQPRDAAAAETE
jgi:HEAT repeat protein